MVAKPACRYRYSLCIVLTSCLLASGCSTAKDLGKTLGDLVTVRAEIIKKFGEKDVNLRVNTFQNQTSISVTYVNSPLNQKTTEDRSKRAQETAEIVTKHYPSIKNVSQIVVGFARVTTRLFVFHWSEMIDIHGFDNGAQRCVSVVELLSIPLNPKCVTRPVKIRQKSQAVASSSKEQREKGLTFVTHFSVAGNVNEITPKPPAEVSLDFASFSEKPKFANLTKIVFLTDTKMSIKPKVSSRRRKQKLTMYTEFLYLKVPTVVFLKITSGNTIQLRLNEHEYPLTQRQLLQMKRMSDYLR